MKNNFIHGEFVPGTSVRENVNPSDVSDIIDHYAQADQAQAGLAIAAARAAFPGWSTGNIQQRADILDRIGSEILARKEELGHLLSREEGKTLPEGIGEAARAGQIFKFFAAEVLRQRGERLPSVRSGVDVEITREPVGVIGIITPWNFPIAIPAWKIAPALAYGNCVVFKPADLVPGSAWALAEIISRSGLPAGVFNLVMGRGGEVGQALIDHPDVNAITLTGSVTTGRRVLAGTAARFAKVQLEMGGKNPTVVLDDADLDVAVNCVVQAAYFSTGQRCTATSRFIVQKGIYPRFIDAMHQRLQALKIDDALKPGTDIGPVVDQSQLQQDLDYIAIGAQEGARLVCGGERVRRDKEGFYLTPALFADAHGAMRIAREEIFGPVACAIPVADYEEALAVSNDTEFGLSAGICTTSLKYATHFKRHAQAGMVMVNVPTAGVDYHVPFGGRKGSSYGSREQGSYAAEFFTTVKTAYTAA
ncbi:MAG TPA: aldehyde dehydrogenase family protein [Noviherbaspirillum sp.]|uniref:aldehyde dehydrogenase family protein n=1 Tax=Noviherbaspirillum sp. TaxID=1926288 RepID=UPI002B479B56|nr:aldehyde dehydrogenase family protein [Noviherbaspirillum sp.]HJV84088.1 aldehyde dehydrogenase family protein [Noviherbaspirillum sp.]